TTALTSATHRRARIAPFFPLRARCARRPARPWTPDDNPGNRGQRPLRTASAQASARSGRRRLERGNECAATTHECLPEATAKLTAHRAPNDRTEDRTYKRNRHYPGEQLRSRQRSRYRTGGNTGFGRAATQIVRHRPLTLLVRRDATHSDFQGHPSMG